MTAHLTIVAGPTGGGKTTTATRIETDTGARRLSADDAMSAASIDLWDTDARARIEAEQRALASELLRSGHDVVVEWGSWTRAERDELRDLARSAGAEVTLIWVDATPEELHRRVTERGREEPPITLQDLRLWDTWIERPTTDEDPQPPPGHEPR